MTIAELKYYIQSANLNFLIGSGASRPFLPTLGDVEKLLTQLNEDSTSEKNVKLLIETSIYYNYYKQVIEPNKFVDKSNPKFITTFSNYVDFLTIWNELINKRQSRLFSKQIYLFTTNVDLMIENAASGLGVELNDGFKGSFKPIYDEVNFMKSINHTSLHYQHTSEIPVFNILKMHGSINWKENDAQIVNNSNWYAHIDNAVGNLDETRIISLTRDDGFGNLENRSYDEMLEEAKKITGDDKAKMQDFINKYQELIIVNPTKRKFEETVMDYHFYELMRMYSNSLEKENSVLFVIGFSFADEHIAKLTRRAADNNPTLKIIIFAFNDAEEAKFKSNLNITSTCANNNITILTPTKLNDSNKDKDGKPLFECKQFDLSSINQLFDFINKQIHVNYE